jgi:hypothetical protein
MIKHRPTGVNRREFLKSGIALGALSAVPAGSQASPAVAETNDREY